MRSIINFIKDNVSVALLYSILTCILIWLAFTAGNDLGYSKGLAAGTTSEYVNGLQDGISSGVGAVLDHTTYRKKVIPYKNDSTL